ncbi:tetraacyldisaccharide 4'-kinase [Methylococcaceae bacterium CS1]|nr:tetraacyldisaccharide 4'-kinase [Methyloprofundus sp.]TXK97495.1 tetraacyldisaccharide 4'-kinase [Methylococcaceae bacterium CS5]TXK97563.1 tetraacyldisaccharide 4'-kinase [Methylococcaceae bacterium CS4]TXL04420.1 tetraacyldisaccharide 4'-kinase [Methylococcaceae bacterium CS3]TXL04989.1 tetraacyldisaccharide 4'-kinase [Methylococcaceae bacterium CS1]TXL09780.1 tetraacyldisaccharide 4'-kinase [Methylococcaceae bacterium CS2]
MKKLIAKFLDEVWYKDHFIGTWIMPFSFIFTDVAKFRRWMYKKGFKSVEKLPVPVIIVGNITLGGTGKTPLVIYLVEKLKAAGFKPGVISRGYGGQSEIWPVRVTADSDAALIGDEPLLIAQQAGCPVAVGPVRADSARLLLDNEAIDVIVSDDGLQHYALYRDIEIVVIDGIRRFGNNFCLPSGPLREPQERIQEVDFVICNGGEPEENEILMQLDGTDAINMQTGERRGLAEFRGINCHALAGIGNPQRFFDLLKQHGIECQTHSFSDHFAYADKDIQFKTAEAVLMTEKDAVKSQSFASGLHWYVPVQATVASDFAENLITLLRTK